MLTVNKNEINLNYLDISFKYYPEYISRVKKIGAFFDSDNKVWHLDITKLNLLLEEFKGELYFATPEWELLGIPAPDYSDMYNFKNKIDIKALGFKLAPFKYQEFGINFLIDRLESSGMAFIADDMGLGKTAQAIGAMKYLFDNKLIKNATIVCKKSIKTQWADEISKFIDFTGDVYIADKSKPKRTKTYKAISTNPNNTILIVNYHLLLNDSDEIKKSDFIAFDEVHTVKNSDGKINKACAKVAKSSKYCVFMTGTPIMSAAEDMYGIISIKDKKYFGTKKEFYDKHLVQWFNGYKNIVVGCKDMDTLRAKMQDVILRRTANEVDIDLPEIIESNINCHLDSVQDKAQMLANKFSDVIKDELEEYKEKSKKENTTKYAEKIAQLEGQAKGIIAVKQICANTPVMFNYTSSDAVKRNYAKVTPKLDYISPKIETLLELLDDIQASGKKTILFTKYETVSRYITNLLNSKNISTVSYSGGMSDNARENSISSFKLDPSVTCIIGTDALAEGVSLQVASNVIHIDLPYTTAIYAQRNGRARRAGSVHSTVFVYNLITENSLDVNIYDKIKETKQNFDAFISVNSAQSKALKELSN